MKVAQHRSLKKLGMESRNSIDRVAADAREMRHAYVLVSRFIDQREAPKELHRHSESAVEDRRGSGD